MIVNDIFLLHPDNHDFLAGKSSTPGSCWNNATTVCAGALLCLGAAIFCFCNDWNRIGGNPENAFGGGFMFLAMAGCLAVLAFWLYYRARSRRNTGCILPGRIISCTGGSDAEGTFGIEIRYAFVNPEGKMIEKKESGDREDLRDAPLPEVGTAVAVLYASDSNFVLL